MECKGLHFNIDVTDGTTGATKTLIIAMWAEHLSEPREVIVQLMKGILPVLLLKMLEVKILGHYCYRLGSVRLCLIQLFTECRTSTFAFKD